MPCGEICVIIVGMTLQPTVISPSILAADFARLGEDAAAVLAAGADWIHFDVMDNHYVPNLTVGPDVCRGLRRFGITAPIDVHLMTRPVDDLIRAFADAGATWISFHPDASTEIDRSLQLIRDCGCRPGLVLNPDVGTEVLGSALEAIDMVLLMSVKPGFSGQKFIPSVLPKMRAVRGMIDASGRAVRLAVDGGIHAGNIGDAAGAGADTFVAGAAIFGADKGDYAAAVSDYTAAVSNYAAAVSDYATAVSDLRTACSAHILPV